ncbi:hypothetical protein ABPG75_002761 [Micractinium tetrahymenae]
MALDLHSVEAAAQQLLAALQQGGPVPEIDAMIMLGAIRQHIPSSPLYPAAYTAEQATSMLVGLVDGLAGTMLTSCPDVPPPPLAQQPGNQQQEQQQQQQHDNSSKLPNWLCCLSASLAALAQARARWPTALRLRLMRGAAGVFYAAPRLLRELMQDQAWACRTHELCNAAGHALEVALTVAEEIDIGPGTPGSLGEQLAGCPATAPAAMVDLLSAAGLLSQTLLLAGARLGSGVQWFLTTINGACWAEGPHLPS